MASSDLSAGLNVGALTPASGVREVKDQPGNEDASAKPPRRVPAEQEKENREENREEGHEEANPEEKDPLAEVSDQPPHELDQML